LASHAQDDLPLFEQPFQEAKRALKICHTNLMSKAKSVMSGAYGLQNR